MVFGAIQKQFRSSSQYAAGNKLVVGDLKLTKWGRSAVVSAVGLLPVVVGCYVTDFVQN